MSIIAASRTIAGGAVAAALLIAATPATALSPTAEIGGRISPNHGRPGTPIKLTTTFSVDPGPGETPGTVNRVVLRFPPNGVVNGRLFPSCAPDVINRARGSFRGCPKGSLIGRGKLRGDVPNLDIAGAPGNVTLFNGPRGKSITVYIQLINPADIRIAFTAPLKKTRGRYGYTMTNPVPEGLQTLIEPDSYGALRWLTATVGATIKDRKGRRRGFIEAKRCPRSGRVPVAAEFYMNEENSRASATGEIICRP